MNERRRELLKVAAKCFKNQSNPFDYAILHENHITLDECGDLSDDVAYAINFYLKTPEKLRSSIEAASLLSKLTEFGGVAKIGESFFFTKAANGCLSDANKILSEFKTEDIAKLTIPHNALDLYLQTITDLDFNVRCLMSFMRLNVLSKVAAEASK